MLPAPRQVKFYHDACLSLISQICVKPATVWIYSVHYIHTYIMCILFFSAAIFGLFLAPCLTIEQG